MIMPQIIPIRDLKNTSEISQKCHATNEPVFITKNGYGDMVIMSMKTDEKQLFMLDIYKNLPKRRSSYRKGKCLMERLICAT